MKLRLTLLTAATLTALSFSAHAVEKRNHYDYGQFTG